ncbi:GNAT family N-acetyltransferase [Streptomyces sp. NBC_01803]|uniref:GNAT family N-acetyltransferase n=1 Tax=Streptomyces sp. NBC_01803 TaxID=2975946 RepID=UPI002DDBCCE9|nr:N-acetyltransferase [Streptomyces sp. NBC_01803]WSA45201.1 N-acetyltransferase [Streptomyces sp. NBC_01803]
MIIRREVPGDHAAVRDVTAAAFGKADGAVPVEAVLLDELRECEGWLPALSLVAVAGEDVVGHVVCTRGHVGERAAVGLGPLSVRPGHQRRGVGLALVHAVLGAADALGEPFVALLGSPAYYGRFGFGAAAGYGIEAPDPAWGPYFQVRPLTAHDPAARGIFRYAEPFDRV